MKQLLLICNPKAGRGLTSGQMMQMIHFYNEKGFLPQVYLTRPDEDFKEIEEQILQADRIVCTGGDGMVNAVVNLLLSKVKREDKLACFGYLPVGTTNDFARSIGIPKTFSNAMHASVSPKHRKLDAGRLGERYFTYVAGFGLFTDVSYKTPQQQKNMLGYIAYLLQGVMSLSELKALRLCVSIENNLNTDSEAEQISGEFILGMVTNSMSVAGLKAFSQPGTMLNDGLFELILIRMPNNILELPELITAILTSNGKSDLLICRRGSHFEFRGDSLAWTLDGEYGGTYKETDISVETGCIQIAVPEKKR